MAASRPWETNRSCLDCERKCKQSPEVTVVECPRKIRREVTDSKGAKAQAAFAI